MSWKRKVRRHRALLAKQEAARAAVNQKKEAAQRKAVAEAQKRAKEAEALRISKERAAKEKAETAKKEVESKRRKANANEIPPRPPGSLSAKHKATRCRSLPALGTGKSRRS